MASPGYAPCFDGRFFGVNIWHGMPEFRSTATEGRARLLKDMALHPWGERLSQVT